jgi:hypothetical protein
MQTKDWLAGGGLLLGLLLFIVGGFTCEAALPPPAPLPVSTMSPKYFLDGFNAVHGIGSLWIGVAIVAAGIIVIMIVRLFARD